MHSTGMLANDLETPATTLFARDVRLFAMLASMRCRSFAPCRRRCEELQADIASLRRELELLRTELRDKSQQLHATELAHRDGRVALADLEVLREQLVNEKSRGAALETDLQQRLREAQTVGERRERELRVKEAMLEDQNDSIKKLKSALSSAQELHTVTERGLNDTIQELMVRGKYKALPCSHIPIPIAAVCCLLTRPARTGGERGSSCRLGQLQGGPGLNSPRAGRCEGRGGQATTGRRRRGCQG